MEGWDSPPLSFVILKPKSSLWSSQHRKTKYPEENSSHFKTAGLNCHLEVPDCFLCLQRQPRQCFWTGCYFSGNWHYGRWMPTLQADKQTILGINEAHLCAMIWQHSTKTFSIQCPFLSMRNLPIRALNIGLATRRRGSKSQTDHLWMKWLQHPKSLSHCRNVILLSVTSLWGQMYCILTTCAWREAVMKHYILTDS